MSVIKHMINSKPSGNGSSLQSGIPESDTAESGEESEPTYRNYETDVCFTQDENEDEASDGVSTIIRNRGLNLQPPNSVNASGHINKILGRDNGNDRNVDTTLLNVVNTLNRAVSSDSDNCTESEMTQGQGQCQINDDTTTSTSESEETQIWVPISKRPSARVFQDATTTSLSATSSNGSDNSRLQSSRPANRTGCPGLPGSLVCAGNYNFVSAAHGNKSNSRAGSIDSTRRYSIDSWRNMQTNILSSGVQKRMSPTKNISVGLLRHDDATGTITLDIRNVPNGNSGPGQDEEPYTASEEPSAGTSMVHKRSTRSQTMSFSDNISMMFSAMYMLFVVAAGLIIPVAEIFVTQPNPALFQGFYIYLYVLSVAFLVYANTFLIRLRTFPAKRRGRTVVSSIPVHLRKRNVVEDNVTEKQTGSFYLRIGAVGFGIASMIKSGLQFGEYFEMTSYSMCSHVLYGIRPIIHLCFTFFQLYFVFLNSKMLIQRYRHLACFGLMHMIATNLSVWFENVVKETLRALRNADIVEVRFNKTGGHVIENYQDLDCHGDSLMGEVVDTSGPYLYPCSIIFSMICSSILFVMWLQLSNRDGKRETEQNEVASPESSNVDCSGSSKGLFLGIIIFVAVVIVLITFFVLVRTKEFIYTAVRLDHLGQVAIFAIAIIAAILALHRMHCLKYEEDSGIDFENVLLGVSVIGVYILCISKIVAGALEDVQQYGHLIIVSSCLRIIQGTLQTVFLLNTARRWVWKSDQESNKPGREFVTFLLICNIALWGMNVFEVQRSKGIPLLEDFYGIVTWNIITHVSVPVAIFFRFHSTVCLANIWKHAWKLRK